MRLDLLAVEVAYDDDDDDDDVMDFVKEAMNEMIISV